MRHPDSHCSYQQCYIHGTWLSISSLSPAALKILNLSVPVKLSAPKKAILSLSSSLDCHLALRWAQPDDRRNRVIRFRMAANGSPGTDASTSWKIICRAWRTILPPILISFTWGYVMTSRQLCSVNVACTGSHPDHKPGPMAGAAPDWRQSRWQESLVQLRAYLHSCT